MRPLRLACVVLSVTMTAACAPRMSGPAPTPSPADTSIGVEAHSALPAHIGEVSDQYSPVPDEAAALLGCAASQRSPVCEVALPSAEEDSAFAAEGARLVKHSEARCRELGEAIESNRSRVRMYRKALIRSAGGSRMYGVGHTYELGDVWLVRVARRLDDLNDRSLDEMTRTLRHEMSHTLGAAESGGNDWTAEDYAARCG